MTGRCDLYTRNKSIDQSQVDKDTPQKWNVNSQLKYLEIFESFQKIKKMTPVRLESSTSRSFCTTEPTDVT